MDIPAGGPSGVTSRAGVVQAGMWNQVFPTGKPLAFREASCLQGSLLPSGKPLAFREASCLQGSLLPSLQRDRNGSTDWRRHQTEVGGWPGIIHLSRPKTSGIAGVP
ncbi:hypothetical protein ACOMHN_015506 [Nucella lapillus]